MDNNELLTAIGTMVDEKLTGLESRFENNLKALEFRFDTKLVEMEDRIVSKTQNVIFGMEEHLTFRLQGVEREMGLMNEVMAPFVKWSHAVEGEVRRIGSELAQIKQRLEKLEQPAA